MEQTNENPLGKTYWEYYKNNYLVVLLVTLVMAILSTGYGFLGDGFGKVYFCVMSFLLCLNIFCVLLSYYQYIKRI